MTGEQVPAKIYLLGQGVADWFGRLPARLVQIVLCVFVLLWLLYQLTQIVILALAQPLSDTLDQLPSTGSIVLAVKPTTINISRLQSLNLFGVTGEMPVVVSPPLAEIEIKATKTRLDLTLQGIVYASQEREAVAMIVHQGRQEQYRIGDKLPVGGRVELSRVYLDHVILDNSGRYESLWLYDEEKPQASAITRPVKPVKPVKPAPAVTDNRSDISVTGVASDYRQRLYKNPSSLAEVLRISPAQKNGELVGYKVSPGKDKQQFSQLGFQSQDIVTSINGVEMDEPSKALEIYKLMRTAREASFMVERGGQSVQIMVSLEDNELQQ